MRTYSTGLTAEVESTATTSSAGAIIDGVRMWRLASSVHGWRSKAGYARMQGRQIRAIYVRRSWMRCLRGSLPVTLKSPQSCPKFCMPEPGRSAGVRPSVDTRLSVVYSQML